MRLVPRIAIRADLMCAQPLCFRSAGAKAICDNCGQHHPLHAGCSRDAAGAASAKLVVCWCAT